MSCAVNASAAETNIRNSGAGVEVTLQDADGVQVTIQESGASVQIPIYARVVYTSALPEFPVTNGSAGGTLPDGTEISMSGTPVGAKWLVVRKIGQEETGPYTYFRDTIGRDKGSLMQAYEIYFLTADRQRLPAIWRTSGYTP